MVISGVFVVDASVLIDVCHGGVHRELMQSFTQPLAPDLVCAEVKNPAIEDMLKLGLQQRDEPPRLFRRANYLSPATATGLASS